MCHFHYESLPMGRLGTIRWQFMDSIDNLLNVDLGPDLCPEDIWVNQTGGFPSWLVSSAALTQYSRWGNLNHRYLFSHSYGDWKSEIRGPAWLGSGKSLLPGLQRAAFLLCPRVTERGTVSELCHVSFYKDINPIGLDPHSYDLT